MTMSPADFKKSLSTLLYGDYAEAPETIAALGSAATGTDMTPDDAVVLMASIQNQNSAPIRKDIT